MYPNRGVFSISGNTPDILSAPQRSAMGPMRPIAMTQSNLTSDGLHGMARLFYTGSLCKAQVGLHYL